MESGDVAGLVFGTLCCLLVVGLPLSIPVYALIVGFRRRKAAQELVAAREPQLAHLLQLNTEVPRHPGPTALVHGTVAYAADFPSRWAAGWRNIAGGHAQSLHQQIDLARRLATVRMLEQATARGAVGVANLRIETSHIDVKSGARNQQSLVIDVFVYGTALLPSRDAGPPQPPAPTGVRP